MNRLIKSLAVSIVLGIVLSLAFNFIVLEICWHAHVDEYGLFAKTMFAVGLLLAPSGFEGQAGVVPLNVIGLSVIFSVVCFVMLRRKYPEKFL